MKLINISTLFLAILILLSCKKEIVKDIERPETPRQFSVSRGDTSVFLKWEGVSSAESYVIIRGLKVIAKDIKTLSYEDQEAPDSSVEYRLYAVNGLGWRSYRYLSDSGYTAIPTGILPRPPAVQATTNDYRYVTLSMSAARFATAYRIYRNDVLIADNYTRDQYIDFNASTSNEIYKIFAINKNGISNNSSIVTGRKSFLYDGSYEDQADGYILKPWTFVGTNIGYYTEGDPTVAAGLGQNGSKALKIQNGKAQLLYDWGGVPALGRYKIAFSVKKSEGGFWVIPSFSSAQHIAASNSWENFTITTGVLQKGEKFNVKLEPYGNSAAFVDNWTIEYLP